MDTCNTEVKGSFLWELSDGAIYPIQPRRQLQPLIRQDGVLLSKFRAHFVPLRPLNPELHMEHLSNPTRNAKDEFLIDGQGDVVGEALVGHCRHYSRKQRARDSATYLGSTPSRPT